MDTEEKINIPVHIGIIMDGNGRWAKKRFMPRSFGHKNGMNRMIELAETAFEMGGKILYRICSFDGKSFPSKGRA